MGRGGKVTRYPEEFKQTAVEMALAEGNTIAGVARDLNMSFKTLHNWIAQHRKRHDQAINKTPVSESLEAENKRLRKENARLKMERDILKKATAYFAKETL
ncbi:MAG: transposase [Campylobacterales bacterium]